MIHAIYILLIFTAYFLGLATIYYSRSQRSYRRARREFQHSLDTAGWDCGMNTTRLGKVTDEDIDYSDIPETPDEFWDNAEVVWPPGSVPGRVTDDDMEWAKERIRKRGYNPDVVDEGPDDNI